MEQIALIVVDVLVGLFVWWFLFRRPRRMNRHYRPRNAQQTFAHFHEAWNALDPDLRQEILSATYTTSSGEQILGEFMPSIGMGLRGAIASVVGMSALSPNAVAVSSYTRPGLTVQVAAMREDDNLEGVIVSVEVERNQPVRFLVRSKQKFPEEEK